MNKKEGKERFLLKKCVFLQKITAHIERYLLNNSYLCTVAENPSWT